MKINESESEAVSWRGETDIENNIGVESVKYLHRQQSAMKRMK
jgi:hypothetical protein